MKNVSDLYACLICMLHRQTSGISLPIPPKKMFGSKDKEVIAERQKGLQVMMTLLSCVLVHGGTHLVHF